MLEIGIQGVYSLLQFAIVFTCQLLPNKVVTCLDIQHPRPPADVRLFGRLLGGQQGHPVAVGSRNRQTASPTAPPIVGWSGRPLAAVRFLCPAKAVPPCPTTALNIKKCIYKCLKWKNYHFSSFFIHVIGHFKCYLGENNLLAIGNQNSKAIINLSSKIHNQVKVYYKVYRVEKVIVPEGKKNNDLVWPS
jgi:hypothetical protein